MGMPSNEYMREYMKRRRDTRRAALLDLLGGRCQFCGAEDGLEIDHVDPAEKAFELCGSNLDRAWAKILEELQKCQALCVTCHLEKTVAWRQPAAHGSETRYLKYKCRCAVCTTAYARIRKGYRSRALSGAIPNQRPNQARLDA